MSDKLYTEAFFKMHEASSRASAREGVPLVLEYVPATSVVDVGCGRGTWLAEFHAAGIDDYLGIDGDYVERDKLAIDAARFLARDLAQPLDVPRRFDLAVSLEVAEHLPAETAEAFVASLVALAPAVLFSAAIPHQGGDGHVNEQWPAYWHEKFAHHDYVVVDCLRTRLWESPTISYWYAQNMLLFIQRDQLGDYPRLARAFGAAGDKPPLALVHPRMYLTTYRRLSDILNKSQRAAARLGFKLRELNLVAFPDWSQPAAAVRAQLHRLVATLAGHPDARRITLLVDVTNQQRELPANLVREVAGQFRLPGGSPNPLSPQVSPVSGSFEREQWEVVLSCLGWRVMLPQESALAIAQAGADAMQTVTLAAIESREPFGGI